MSISLGGLSLLSLSSPFLAWNYDSHHARAEFRSFLCALVFVVVILILAYLTNPSETSFRAYLTEQSFRQHLSRLDDTTDDTSDNDSSVRLIDSSPSQDRTTLPFHFANRASVSLRTPKHIFHSFGICTIATTRGAAGNKSTDTKPGQANGNALNNDASQSDGSVVSDSWFLGAFGHWWRGGLVESWYHDVMVRSRDAEGWNSGILGFKVLDNCSRLPFSRSNPFPRLSLGSSPPKLRNRERSSSNLGHLSRRNSTPPPLPKSVSLPLHADRRQPEGHSPSLSQPTLLSADHKRIAVVHPQSISRAPSLSSIENSPLIAEVLRQISAVQSTVSELQTQVADTHAAAAQSHGVLEEEVTALRERKRGEDLRRNETKSRTKTLEDAKRTAEAGKREAEKKLKLAHGAREGATRRLEELETEMAHLRASTDDDRAITTVEQIDEQETEVIVELEERKREIRIAEEVVAALNARARELEEKITEGREKLRMARERMEIADQDRSFFPLHVLSSGNGSGASELVFSGNDNVSTNNGNGHIVNGHDYGLPNEDAFPWSTGSFSPFDSPVIEHASAKHAGSDSGEISHSPRPTRLSLGALSNFSPTASTAEERSPTTQRAKGYAIFDNDIASLGHHHQNSVPIRTSIGHGHGYSSSTTFAPFGDTDNTATTTHSTAFIPSSLISVLDSPAELQTERDVTDNLDWYPAHTANDSGTLSASPTSVAGQGSLAEPNSDLQYGPFDYRPHSHSPFEAMKLPYRTHSDPSTHVLTDDLTVHGNTEPHPLSGPRRWFSASVKGSQSQRKGLNPDAKVFRLPRRNKLPSPAPPAVAYDALNPTGVMSTTSSTPSSLLRAFAPSRAEREVLQRVLGGSTNASLERLPSLSDVGSIPSSPVHSHATPQIVAQREREKSLPAWLQSLPLPRKPNFSPWDDEDEEQAISGTHKRR
ncbi:hypothetical protein BJ138DRAFT_1126734 [Hygrophoropsis aurantiaca]|uniref:Uncharacterized protein n=1 Tax=Hygrophoropsis aurantiaca TaxID=72124 RepID=A0ACB8ABW3_9AGAM|nr:hypothetical protein BJ138DRAFT_1126734 [Hygrophoropsis aurantiaca]